MKTYETRDIIYGFITYDDWEREIINHPVFQRLRRIKQLSLTDMVYPGANHTRFEHSLGVMHLATLFYENIIKKRSQFLKDVLKYDESGLGFERDKKIIRFAALLHDIGHSPFSHAGEELMPLIPPGHIKYKEGENKRFSHEDYSIAIIKKYFKDIIESNDNYEIRVEDVTALLGDETVRSKRRLAIWKNIISSQLDADRADYLLRDSLHLGVSYGIYDKNRLVNTMSIATDKETYGTNLAIEEGGWHVAESLVLARYQMFSQVYFHKTRRAYDHHVEKALKEILLNHGNKSGFFPPPDSEDNLKKYIDYDDWMMYGLIKEGLGGEHGKIIIERSHDRCVHQTSEVPDEAEFDKFEDVLETFKDEISFDDFSEKSWYKTGKEDILILCDPDDKEERVEPLSRNSSIVKTLQPIKQKRVYAKKEVSKAVKEKIRKYLEGKK